MKSPFPGMDPYLEPYWSDVHTSLMIHLRNQLQRQLPDGLRAAVEESVRVDDDESAEESEAQQKWYGADVAVIGSSDETALSPRSGGGAALAEPVRVQARPFRERHIEIVATRSGRRVVTVIEVLSPANKSGERERAKFLDKRDHYLAGGVNYAEIDLLRSGRPLPHGVPEEAQCYTPKDYLVRVFRSFQEIWEIYPISMREPLPAFRIPLRRQDADVAVDLQAAIAAAYEEGAYDREIDYTAPPVPAFDEEDQAWAKTCMG